MDYSLQGNRKTGADHPNATRSFNINEQVRLAMNGPAGHFGGHKKEELIGNYENTGRQWRGKSELVNGHDLTPVPRVYPYGI